MNSLHWTIAAPFTVDAASEQWLVPFVPAKLQRFSLVSAGLLGGIKRCAARLALARVDRFVVDSRRGCARHAQWLELPAQRFRFVPLQRASISKVHGEDGEHPFVLAMGSARRDYATLFEAVSRSKHPTLVGAARHALEGLEIPANVEVR